MRNWSSDHRSAQCDDCEVLFIGEDHHAVTHAALLHDREVHPDWQLLKVESRMAEMEDIIESVEVGSRAYSDAYEALIDLQRRRRVLV